MSFYKEKNITAGTFLPKNCSTKDFSVHELLLPFDENKSSHTVMISHQGFICLKYDQLSRNENNWIRFSKIAKGVHEHNAILVRSYGNYLKLKVVKDINPDEEILLWFSEEVQSLMGISFLSLENIQGENRYICMKCQKIYENPNPLKIHIATNCERFPFDILWRRLVEKVECAMLPRDDSIFPNQLNYMSNYFNNFSLRQTSPTVTHPKIFFNTIIGNASSNSSPVSKSPLSQQSTLQHSHIHTTPVLNASPLETASHLETIVSNMGTSRNGHICIYCGKLYSRKYGLKIHIRTHTGFKPLKCKYCLRPFGDPSNLNKHLRLHAQNSNETAKYRCTICNKNLVRRRDLVRHIQAKHKLIHLDADSFSSLSEDDDDSDVSKEINKC